MTNEFYCNIGYLGGTHGAFLKYFIDKYSKRTPDIKGNPFLKNGTSHDLSVKYSNKIERHAFEDVLGNWIDDFNYFNFNQNSVIILLDNKSLLTFCRLQFLRDSDHELKSTQVIKINESDFSVNQTFKYFFKNDFKSIYNINLDDENCPKILLRDYLKIMFLDEHKNYWLLTTKKIIKNLNEKTTTINLSEIYNTEKFLNKIALSLDAKDGYLSVSGWKEISNQLTLEYLKEVNDYGVGRLIYTDITRDGMKQSPNFDETMKVAEMSNCPVIISGGVSSIDDIKKAKNLKNVEGIIVGKAIYDGDIKLEELVKEDA